MRWTNDLAVEGVAAALLVAAAAPVAWATVEPNLYADTYLVVDGSRTFSVLDIYVKGNHLGDRISNAVLGLSTHPLIFKTSLRVGETDVFVHGGGAGNGWLPTDDAAKSWDSFIACGNRAQGSGARITNRAGAVIDHGIAGNWTGGSAFSQFGVAGSNFIDEGSASGWYSAKGGNPSSTSGAAENPFARVSLYDSYWASSYPDLYRGSDVLHTKGPMQRGRSIAAGPAELDGSPGAALDFHWMIGRFAIDVTERAGETITMQVQLNIVGKHGSGTNLETGTTFSGALITGTNPQFKVSRHFTFAQTAVPCVADLDANAVVDSADVGLLLLDYGSCAGCASDLDSSGTVDAADVALVLLDYGPCP